MKHISKLKKLIMLGVLVIITFSWTTVAYADFGPKSKLDVYVKNAPNELYYLDLLSKEPASYDNLQPSEREALNQDMLNLLFSYENEGWRPGLAGGTYPPMYGELVGEKSGDEMLHTFSYFGVPDTYRIIIVTESGKVTVSDAKTRWVLQGSVTYDYNTGKLTTPPIFIGYIVQFFTTCIPTLIIEVIILLLFGFKLKDNWRNFILINVATQVFLTLTMGTSLIKDGALSAFSIQFPMEILILIVETILFCKMLIGKSKGRRCAYGIIANLVSWATGFFLMFYQYEFLVKFL